MIRSCEEADEFRKGFRRTLGASDQALPFMQRPRMHTSQGKPAVTVRERDGQIPRMLRNMGRDPLPTEYPILATKMVIFRCHPPPRCQKSWEKQDWCLVPRPSRAFHRAISAFAWAKRCAPEMHSPKKNRPLPSFLLLLNRAWEIISTAHITGNFALLKTG